MSCTYDLRDETTGDGGTLTLRRVGADGDRAALATLPLTLAPGLLLLSVLDRGLTLDLDGPLSLRSFTVDGQAKTLDLIYTAWQTPVARRLHLPADDVRSLTLELDRTLDGSPLEARLWITICPRRSRTVLRRVRLPLRVAGLDDEAALLELLFKLGSLLRFEESEVGEHRRDDEQRLTVELLRRAELLESADTASRPELDGGAIAPASIQGRPGADSDGSGQLRVRSPLPLIHDVGATASLYGFVAFASLAGLLCLFAATKLILDATGLSAFDIELPIWAQPGLGWTVIGSALITAAFVLWDAARGRWRLSLDAKLDWTTRQVDISKPFDRRRASFDDIEGVALTRFGREDEPRRWLLELQLVDGDELLLDLSAGDETTGMNGQLLALAATLAEALAVPLIRKEAVTPPER